jgi:hypothetical protein
MSRGPEDREQRAVKQVYALVGAIIYDLSQGYRPEPGGTRQTPGLPDLFGFLPTGETARLQVSFQQKSPVFTHTTLFWHEVKTEAGLKEHHRLLEIPYYQLKKSQVKKWHRAQAQRAFRERCEERSIPYAIGGVDAAKALLLKLGLAFKDQSQSVLLIGPTVRVPPP